MDGFYKNLSITGGFLLLHIAGAGSYSIDGFQGVDFRGAYGWMFACHHRANGQIEIFGLEPI